MQLITDGVVIAQKSLKENDRLITVLTREYGLITAFANRARQVSGRLLTATQLLAFSDFTIYKGKSTYVINSADVKTIFHKLFSDLEKLTLAQYFCELMAALCPHDENTNEHLRLILNSLHLLGENKKPDSLIKSVFEMRLMTISGYMPDLIGCNGCGEYIKPQKSMFFFTESSRLLCEDCITDEYKEHYTLTPGVLTALRHTVYADFEKLFSFTLSDKNLALLAQISESYLLSKLDRDFNTLKFYKEITAQNN